MKKTVTINLGGLVFCLEEDAYQVLAFYLKRLENHFSKDPGKQEILNDIEARMAEHLKEKFSNPNQVVNIDEVNRVIGIMGEPSDIEGDASKSQTTKSDSRSYRRLYRDPDNRVIGGVCAGMGAYWNIDPIILRILFIIAFFCCGGLLIYIILWIVIPTANTAAEKLEMRGEPVTAENIGKSFQETEYKK